MHDSNFSIYSSYTILFTFFIFQKLIFQKLILCTMRKISRSIRKVSERKDKKRRNLIGLLSFVERNSPPAKIFPIDGRINLKTRERAWCLARLMLRLPTRAPAWNANPSRKGSRLSASSGSRRDTHACPSSPSPLDTCVRPRWPVVTARPAYAIKNCWTKRRIKIRAIIKGNVYFRHDSCGLHVLLPILLGGFHGERISIYDGFMENV